MMDKNTMMMQQEGDPEATGSPLDELYYAVYQYNAVTEDGITYARAFILMKNGNGVIVRFTRLHDYAGVYAGRPVVPESSNPAASLYFPSLR